MVARLIVRVLVFFIQKFVKIIKIEVLWEFKFLLGRVFIMHVGHPLLFWFS